MSLEELHFEYIRQKPASYNDDYLVLSNYEFWRLTRKQRNNYFHGRMEAMGEDVNVTRVYTPTKGFKDFDDWANSLSCWTGSGHMRFYPRANFLDQPRPVPLYIGSATWAWPEYISWEDKFTHYNKELPYHSDKEGDFYFDLNRVHFLTNWSGDSIRIQMQTFSPYFKNYEVNLNNKGWEKSEDVFSFKPLKGSNNAAMRVRTVNPWPGMISTLSFILL
ncbi:MAG: hypothetical protein ABIA63_14545, partial [bacterium]